MIMQSVYNPASNQGKVRAARNAAGRMKGFKPSAYVQEAEEALVRQVQEQIHKERAGLAIDWSVGQRARNAETNKARCRNAL